MQKQLITMQWNSFLKFKKQSEKSFQHWQVQYVQKEPTFKGIYLSLL